MNKNSDKYIIYNYISKIYYNVSNLSEFCKEYGLSEPCMRDVLKKRQMQHKGYFAKYIYDSLPLEENVNNYIQYINKPKYKYIKKNIPKKIRYNQSEEFQYFKDNIILLHEKHHINEKLSCAEIALLYKTNTETIRLLFHKNNLKVCNFSKTKKGENHHTFFKYSNEVIDFLQNFSNEFTKLHYEDKLSVKEISDKYKISYCTITNYCKKYNIKYDTNISEPHKIIVNFLNELGIEYETNNRSIIKPKELDIYIPSHNLAIEINGLYWHSSDKLEKNYHLLKKNDCISKNIELLQFWDIEIVNKLNIVKSIICTKLNKNTKIFARKCKLQIIDSKIAKIFCDENHLSSGRYSKINYGLYYNDELYMVICINKNKKYQYELIRSCTKNGFSVIGGLSKLLNAFYNNYNNPTLLSYCDNRVFSGNSYISCGFKFIGLTKPNYWYYQDNEYILKSRIMFQKHKLKNILKIYDDKLSEWDNMKLNKYKKIYDCGSLIYIKNNEEFNDRI